MDILKGRRSLHRWAVANLVANMAIVWTGALVRLTKSGLGCPTWPQCDAGSYVPHPEAEWHAFIEFGNRLLTFVLIAIALGTAITVFRTVRARRVRMLSILIGLGIGLQGVVGGLTVLSQLNPWVVGLHMVLSVGLIVATPLSGSTADLRRHESVPYSLVGSATSRAGAKAALRDARLALDAARGRSLNHVDVSETPEPIPSGRDGVWSFQCTVTASVRARA